MIPWHRISWFAWFKLCEVAKVIGGAVGILVAIFFLPVVCSYLLPFAGKDTIEIVFTLQLIVLVLILLIAIAIAEVPKKIRNNWQKAGEKTAARTRPPGEPKESPNHASTSD